MFTKLPKTANLPRTSHLETVIWLYAAPETYNSTLQLIKQNIAVIIIYHYAIETNLLQRSCTVKFVKLCHCVKVSMVK